MIDLLLTRHGITDWNAEHRYLGSSDPPLNDVGLHQAQLLAARLRTEKIASCYCSDLKRTAQTADAIDAALGIKMQPDPRLREMCFGVFEGLTFLEAQARYPQMLDAWLRDYDQPPQGGESFSAFSERVADFLADVTRVGESGKILIVAHGGPLREMLRLCLGLPRSGHWYFTLEPASLSAVSINEAQPNILYLNRTGHLREVKP